MRILLLIVAFNNHGSVESFLNTLEERAESRIIEVALCDNSPRPGGWRPSHAAVAAFLARPDNPGYLEGAQCALTAYVARIGSMPDWVLLTNTDLRIRFKEMIEILSEYGQYQLPLVLAPRITEGAVERNPHVVQAYPRWRHRLNRMATSSTPLAFLYLCLSYLKATTRERWSRRHPRERPPLVVGERMYSPYGATVIFSKGFFEVAKLPRLVPLFAEEFAIAEAARQAAVPIVYEPRIHIEHDARSTTGPRISFSRAAQLRDAFRYIWQQASQWSRTP
jgi:hypothetical protein